MNCFTRPKTSNRASKNTIYPTRGDEPITARTNAQKKEDTSFASKLKCAQWDIEEPSCTHRLRLRDRRRGRSTVRGCCGSGTGSKTIGTAGIWYGGRTFSLPRIYASWSPMVSHRKSFGGRQRCDRSCPANRTPRSARRNCLAES